MEIRQDPKAWQAGYDAGRAGKAPTAPPDVVDELAFLSGVIEGKAAYDKLGPERKPARVLPFPGAEHEPR
jgi:hypothetical protein